MSLAIVMTWLKKSIRSRNVVSIEVTILDNYKIEKITPQYVDDLIDSDLTLLT